MLATVDVGRSAAHYGQTNDVTSGTTGLMVVGPAGGAGFMPCGEGLLQWWFGVRQAVPTTWEKGAVTLVGDAAHSMPPTRAQGANQALEHAWLLARILRQPAASVPETLRRYERARAPKAGYVARAAGKEDINEYRPRLIRLIPDAFASRYFTRFLGRCSNFLTCTPAALS